MQRRFLLSMMLSLLPAAIAAQEQSAKPLADVKAPAVGATESSVFRFQDNFWVNLHHFLRSEARRRSSRTPPELPLTNLSAGERSAWESALGTYADLAKRSFIFDPTLVQIDNALAMQSSSSLTDMKAIDPRVAAALNGAAPIYRGNRWNQDHLENQRWITTHTDAISKHAPPIKAAIGRVFGIEPPADPIMVDVVRDVGPYLAYTTAGPPGFSGHTFISPQANSDPNVALDTILHEISHTMDEGIVATINAEAAQQHVQIPPDLWHAVTLYTTGELVRRELGRSRDDATYAPNAAFPSMFATGSWPAIFADLQAHWLPYLNGEGNRNEALTAVVRNAPH